MVKIGVFFTPQSTETQASPGLRCVGHSTAPRREKAEGEKSSDNKGDEKEEEAKVNGAVYR